MTPRQNDDRATAIRNLQARAMILIVFLSVIGGALRYALLPDRAPPPVLIAIGLIVLVGLAVPLARNYLPLARRWADLNETGPDLGLRCWRYPSIALDAVAVLMPAIGAGLLMALAFQPQT